MYSSVDARVSFWVFFLVLLVKQQRRLILGPVYDVLKKCGLRESPDGYFKFFPTVHDAVHHAQEAVVQISVITSL